MDHLRFPTRDQAGVTHGVAVKSPSGTRLGPWMNDVAHTFLQLGIKLEEGFGERGELQSPRPLEVAAHRCGKLRRLCINGSNGIAGPQLLTGEVIHGRVDLYQLLERVRCLTAHDYRTAELR